MSFVLVMFMAVILVSVIVSFVLALVVAVITAKKKEIKEFLGKGIFCDTSNDLRFGFIHTYCPCLCSWLSLCSCP